MGERVKVAAAADVEPGKSICVKAGNERVAVFNIDGEYFAMSDMCPHAGGPLSEGFVNGTQVSCPWHGWMFDLCPGDDAPKDGVERYTVHVEGDDLHLELPEG
jgi:nitrite reductase/ring-hydroxylating ferredoxin subunit